VGLLNGVAIFPVDRDLYLHEYRSSAAYSPATFLCAFTLVELPLEILASIVSIELAFVLPDGPHYRYNQAIHDHHESRGRYADKLAYFLRDVAGYILLAGDWRGETPVPLSYILHYLIPRRALV
jgi:hypothetical protein